MKTGARAGSGSWKKAANITRCLSTTRPQDYLTEYLEKAGFQPNAPLFQTFRKRKPTGRAMSRSEAYQMIRRRAIEAAIFAPFCCHSFRATEITVYLENKGTLETAQKIAAHESP
jgi:integrase